jgi:hypothetical protein
MGPSRKSRAFRTAAAVATRLTREPTKVFASSVALVMLVVVTVPIASGTASKQAGYQMLTIARPTPATFYPYVHDGHLDTVEIRLFLDNADPNVLCNRGAYTVEIRDRTTKTIVRHWVSPFSQVSRGLRLLWDGRDDHGALAPAGGRYTVDAAVTGTCDNRTDGTYAYAFSLAVRAKASVRTATARRSHAPR